MCLLIKLTGKATAGRQAGTPRRMNRWDPRGLSFKQRQERTGWER
jgi:hypothetical protein